MLDQELLNAVYSGPFVSDARRHFSKNGCPAYKMGADYLTGNAIEQAYLATILKWAARHDGIEKVDKYMAIHQFDPNANRLWAQQSLKIARCYAVTATVSKAQNKIPKGENFSCVMCDRSLNVER